MGRHFEKNRRFKKVVENLMDVEPEVALLCLGDINGRLTKLEPHINTDHNGKMIERWTTKMNLHHLNQTEECIGTYTFNSNNGKSAIDYMLVNDELFGGYKGIHIDEGKELLNISDHCLVRAWFKIGSEENIKWNKQKKKDIV